MDENEKLKLGDIFLAPKEFFLNNSVGNVKQNLSILKIPIGTSGRS